ncbi:MAG TPA: hypothetical protein P5186_10375 [Candidatus Paceibacterota bacterium]|nr:hypothetical protein [Candidatus Paceibacterota bacterium]
MLPVVLNCLLCVQLSVVDGSAILFSFTGDPAYHTSAPTGTLSGSGWEYEGSWGSYLGTAISPSHFITATHVYGSVGDVFVYNGNSYTTIAKHVSAFSDLTIWEVQGSFASYAPLYTGIDEWGKDLIVFGRGTQRGAAITVGSEEKGWRWGQSDGVQRWGQNTVSGIASGGATLGQFLVADFDRDAGKNEAHLSRGDSGGGVFIQDEGIWKLAGINYAVDGPFSLNGTTGSGFDAALYDAGGLYYYANGTWHLREDQSQDIATSFYATRISSNQTWIQSIVAVPETEYATTAACVGLAVFAAWCQRGQRQRPT